jgi:Ca2+-binding EF-hand superfamily protein
MKTSFCKRLPTRGRLVLLAFPLIVTAAFAEEPAPEKAKTLPAAILRKYDADRDGRLSETERTAWKEDVQRGRAEAQARRLERFDANHDGKLDKAEKAEAAKAGNAKSGGKATPTAKESSP